MKKGVGIDCFPVSLSVLEFSSKFSHNTNMCRREDGSLQLKNRAAVSLSAVKTFLSHPAGALGNLGGDRG